MELTKRKILFVVTVIVLVSNVCYSQEIDQDVLKEMYKKQLKQLIPLTDNFHSDSNKLKLEITDHLTLKENQNLLSDVVSASLNNSGQFVVATDHTSGVVLYDSTGKQIRKIGDIGRGPAEYGSPGIVKLFSDTIYVWDKSLLKLLMYNLNNELLSEIADFRWAIRDFTVHGRKLYMYNVGNTSGEFIEEYQIDKNDYGEFYGKRTEEHTFLMLLHRAGGVSHKGLYVYYVSPSALRVHKINTNTNTEISFNIADEDFFVPDINNARKLIQSQKEAITTLQTSSSVTGIYALQDYLVVKASIGNTKYQADLGGYAAFDVYVRLYILNYDMELVDTFTFSMISQKGSQFKYWGANDQELFLLNTTDLFGEPVQKMSKQMPYHLYRWKIKKIEQ